MRLSGWLAALAVNAFGFFIRGGSDLPPLLGCEEEVWPASGEAVDDRAKAQHRDEIKTFGAAEADDEVSFVSRAWRQLLEACTDQPDSCIRVHAQAVTARFNP